MVRHEYCINDLSIQDLYSTLEKTSANDPVNMPLDETWMVQWSRFFEINDTRPNFSRRSRTVSQRRVRATIERSFRRSTRPSGLGCSTVTCSAPGLPACGRWTRSLPRSQPGNRSSSRCHACLPTAPIASASSAIGWSPHPAYGALTAEDVETLSNDPPLPFFILFEAMQQPQAEGQRLGPLGSILVSEVIFGVLAGDPRSSSGAALAGQLADLSREYYSGEFLPGNSRHLKHGAVGEVHHRNRRTAAGRACLFVKRNYSVSPNPEEQDMQRIEGLQVTNHAALGQSW